jgi:hypothetical protein
MSEDLQLLHCGLVPQHLTLRWRHASHAELISFAM